MSDLRQRIEQRITDLRVERDIAAAVRGGWWTVAELTAIDDDNAMFPEADAIHIATQDPFSTIARIDRELAGCAADLALLDELESRESNYGGEVFTGPLIYADVRRNLAARYPSEESS